MKRLSPSSDRTPAEQKFSALDAPTIILNLLESTQPDRDEQLERVLIETCGVGNPQKIFEKLAEEPWFKTMVGKAMCGFKSRALTQLLQVWGCSQDYLFQRWRENATGDEGISSPLGSWLNYAAHCNGDTSLLVYFLSQAPPGGEEYSLYLNTYERHQGHLPLVTAVAQRNLLATQLLLAKGASPTACINFRNVNAIYAALAINQPQILECLITQQFKEETDRVSAFKKYLHSKQFKDMIGQVLAHRLESIPLVLLRLMQDWGYSPADINALVDSTQEWLLEYAAEFQDSELLGYVMEQKLAEVRRSGHSASEAAKSLANYLNDSKQHYLPLFKAIQRHRVGNIERLIAAGASLTAMGSGYNALSMSIKSEEPWILRHYITDLNEPIGKWLPLVYAWQFSKAEISEDLIARGADFYRACAQIPAACDDLLFKGNDFYRHPEFAKQQQLLEERLRTEKLGEADIRLLCSQMSTLALAYFSIALLNLRKEFDCEMEDLSEPEEDNPTVLDEDALITENMELMWNAQRLYSRARRMGDPSEWGKTKQFMQLLFDYEKQGPEKQRLSRISKLFIALFHLEEDDEWSKWTRWTPAPVSRPRTAVTYDPGLYTPALPRVKNSFPLLRSQVAEDLRAHAFSKRGALSTGLSDAVVHYLIGPFLKNNEDKDFPNFNRLYPTILQYRYIESVQTAHQTCLSEMAKTVAVANNLDGAMVHSALTTVYASSGPLAARLHDRHFRHYLSGAVFHIRRQEPMATQSFKNLAMAILKYYAAQKEVFQSVVVNSLKNAAAEQRLAQRLVEMLLLTFAGMLIDKSDQVTLTLSALLHSSLELLRGTAYSEPFTLMQLIFGTGYTPPAPDWSLCVDLTQFAKKKRRREQDDKTVSHSRPKVGPCHFFSAAAEQPFILNPRWSQQLGWNCFDVAIDRKPDIQFPCSHLSSDFGDSKKTDIRRSGLVNYALGHKHVGSFRQLLLPEILQGILFDDKHFLLRGDQKMIGQVAAYHALDIEQQAQLSRCNEKLPKAPSGKARNLEQLNEFFTLPAHATAYSQESQQVREMVETRDRCLDPLRAYCLTEDVYARYLSTYYDAGKAWVIFDRCNSNNRSTSIVDIAALFIGKTIVIHDMSSGVQPFTEIYRTANPSSQTVDVGYNHHTKHFMALLPNPKLQQTSPYAPRMGTG